MGYDGILSKLSKQSVQFIHELRQLGVLWAQEYSELSDYSDFVGKKCLHVPRKTMTLPIPISKLHMLASSIWQST